MAAGRWALTLAILLILTVVPSVGAAGSGCGGATTTTPPGDSEVDQYAETVPGSCGDETPGSAGSSQNATPGSDNPISQSAAGRLEGLGADGQAAAQTAAANAPALDGRQESGGAGHAADNGSRSGLGQIASVAFGADDDGGMGVFLPLTLLVIGVGGVAFAISRRRAGGAA